MQTLAQRRRMEQDQRAPVNPTSLPKAIIFHDGQSYVRKIIK